MNYRLITVSILDGSRYDVFEAESFASIVEHSKVMLGARWDLHCFVVDIEANTVMGILFERPVSDFNIGR